MSVPKATVYSWVVICCLAALSSGCVSIEDRAPNRLSPSIFGDYWLRVFVDTYRTTPTSVRAAIGTTEYPMTDVGGGEWRVSVPFVSCAQQTVQVRYIVDYPSVNGSTATRVEPLNATATVGGFLKSFLPRRGGCTPSKIIYVNNADFAVDSAPGDGMCDANPPGTGGTRKCTLRAAIGEANAVAGPVMIWVPAGNYPTPIGDYFTPTDDVVIQGEDRDRVTIGQISIYGASGNVPTVEVRSATLPFGVRSQLGSLMLNDVMIADARPAAVNGAVEALGQLSIENSTIIRGYPNGVYFRGAYAQIVNSLIADNGTQYGGVACAPSAASSEIDITNSTISGNQGVGGVFLMSGCTALVRNSTIARNVATQRFADAMTPAAGGLVVAGGAEILLSNTILADNTNPLDVTRTDCSVGIGTGTATLDSLGYNLFGTVGPCAFQVVSGRTDLSGVSANLAPLADNGGRTWSSLPNTGSPAIGSGATDPYNDAYPFSCMRTDQRGVLRAGACTIGAAQP